MFACLCRRFRPLGSSRGRASYSRWRRSLDIRDVGFACMFDPMGTADVSFCYLMQSEVRDVRHRRHHVRFGKRLHSRQLSLSQIGRIGDSVELRCECR
jgi:hypothetical protein